MEQINIVFALGILASQAFILFIIFTLVFKQKSILEFFGRKGIWLAFLVSLGAMLGSLYYSEIAKLEPCTLCWYQRIFAYPNVFILGLALFKKNKAVIPYSLTLSWIGLLLAIYHGFIQATNSQSVVCATGSHIDCAQNYFLYFGYITIPTMSITTFLLVIIFLSLTKKYG